MNSHPDGTRHTRHMLELAALESGSKILDMGAGDGETLEILRKMGFIATGIDLAPRGECVEKCDFLNTPYPDGSFDAIISQCAFYAGGDIDKALLEAHRLLRRGGTLLLSDVWFTDPAEAVTKAGFNIMHREDMTALWREYYIEALWRGESCPTASGRCTYEALILKSD